MIKNYLANLNWRYATKEFDRNRKLNPEQMALLTQSLILSPSSFGLQPWKFILVENPDMRQKIRVAAWDQGQVTDASHLWVLASRKGLDASDVEKFIKETATERKATIESLVGYKDLILGFVSSLNSEKRDDWCARQTYVALGFLLSAAAQNQIDACPMEGFDPKAVDELLGLNKLGYTSRVLCPVGFRAESDKYATLAKVRYPETDLVQKI
ncbi:MAG: NAD(P)H-dependent oxidoreductase [Patescibacteria group bacterium]